MNISNSITQCIKDMKKFNDIEKKHLLKMNKCFGPSILSSPAVIKAFKNDQPILPILKNENPHLKWLEEI